jgi:hypothetical protein
MSRKEKEQKDEDFNEKTKLELMRDSTMFTEKVIENGGVRCSQIFALKIRIFR